MRATTNKLLAVQTVLWRLQSMLETDPGILQEMRELFWVELELRTELHTKHLQLMNDLTVSYNLA